MITDIELKRYALFSGCDYYPRGGSRDFQGSFGSIEEAQQRIPKTTGLYAHEWAQVVDLLTGGVARYWEEGEEWSGKDPQDGP